MVKKIDKDVFSSCHARWTKKKSAHEEPSLGRKEGRPWGRGSGGRREKRIYNTLKKKKNRSGIQLIWLFFPNTGKSKIIV